VEKESCWRKGWREKFVLELLLSSVKSWCSAGEGNLTNATPAEKLILQRSMAGEEGAAFSVGVVVAGTERKPAALTAIINPLPSPEGLVLFLLQRVRVVMFKLCLWRKRAVDGVVWSRARKEESEDGASSPLFCSCKPRKKKGS